MNEDSIFTGALEHTSPEERAAYLEAICAGDPALRARVEALLAAHGRPDTLLDEPLVPSPATTADRPTDLERPGTQIGRYKLLEEIGEGGFGVVYMAEQQEPVRRKVALKIIKPGMDTRAVIARFEAERQALAMMDHPNIARVLDAGTTDDSSRHTPCALASDGTRSVPATFGRPYFVMELVHGVPITQFCDEAQLPPRERLELFIPVCQAIQHAHQKGIIHRDIKPSNILVSLYDGRPVPKVIDFGVAKALQQRLTEKTMFTHFGQVIGTLEYMSPEQAERSELDIDTRADVYSLGAVLYELLTGTPPLERSRLRSAAFDEILRMIREEEPPRPSLRLSSSEKLATISAQRKTEPARLSHLVHGELDWIVMKALDKQRSRRYETANGLARDIERYLAEEPVEAGPPSASYRLRKLAYRHRRPLAIAAAFLALLAVTAVFSSVQWVRATNSAIAFRDAEQQAIKDRDEKERQRIRAVGAERAATQQQQRAEASAAEARRNLYTAHMQQIQLEWDRSNIARVRELLNRYANPAGDQDDQRGWEWNYWTRMCEQDLRTLKRHEGEVTAVAFNSDGSLVASAGRDGKVCIWNTGDGTLVREIKAHEGAATCVAFHGTTIASGGSDRMLRLWDATDGHKIAEFWYGNIVSCVAFSSDGKLLAVGCTSEGARPVPGRPIERRIIDTLALKERHRLDSERNVYNLAFTKDASQLVIAATPNIEYWDARTGKLVRDLQVDQLRDNNLQYYPTSAIEVSHTGEFLVTANEDPLVHVRRFNDAETIKTLRGHSGLVRSVALSPDEKVIASAGADNCIILWNVAKGEEIRRLRGHEKQIRRVTFSPDGLRLASASDDGTVKIWDAAQPTDFRPFLTASLSHHMTAAFSQDGRLYAVSHFGGPPAAAGNTFNQSVEVRDAFTGMRAYEFAGHHGWIDALAWSHDGTMLASGARDRTVRIYDTASQSQSHTLDEFTRSIAIVGLAFSPDDRWLQVMTVDVDSNRGIRAPTQQVWDATTGKRSVSFTASSFSFHPQEEICAVAAVGEDRCAIEFYRTDQPLAGQTPFRTWKLDEAAAALRYDHDGRRLAASLGNKIVVWEASRGDVATTISETVDLREYQSFLGFDERGERLFTQSGAGKLSVWRTDTGDLMCEVPLPPEGVHMGVSISPDGLRIVARNLQFNHLLELRPLDEEGRNRLEARNLDAHLLDFPTQMPPYLTRTKAELLDEVSILATISADVRRLAAELIEHAYTPQEEAWQFGSYGQQLIWRPDKTPADYQEGLKWTEAAAKIDPKHFGFDYGLALYRVGRYEESLKTIEDSEEGRIEFDPNSRSAVLAVKAMAQFQLDKKEEAIGTLAAAKADSQAQLPYNVELVREAKALIEPDNRGEEDMAAGTTFARAGQWQEAIDAFARAEKQLAGDLRAECLYYLAYAHFGAGDRDAHRRVCRQLAAEFDIANDRFAAGRLAYASVVDADALDDWSMLASATDKHKFERRIVGALKIRPAITTKPSNSFPKTGRTCADHGTWRLSPWRSTSLAAPTRHAKRSLRVKRYWRTKWLAGSMPTTGTACWHIGACPQKRSN